jgi:hypothetical protein
MASTSSPEPRRNTQPSASRSASQDLLRVFGSAVSAKLWPGVGSDEDHLRAPFENLLHRFGAAHGLSVGIFGETRLSGLAVRPDYAVDVGGVRVGYVELKAPGKGVPSTWKPSRHDSTQWAKLSCLPNVLYTDGQEWALYRSGELAGDVVRLSPALRSGGKDLRDPSGSFDRLVLNFLTWEPERPRSIQQLVRAVAILCRLLRDEVREVLQQEAAGKQQTQLFSALARDWRQLLFPRLTDHEFADAYAQTVTFALLLARVEGIDFNGRSMVEIARLLGKKHSLMGKALAVLTEESVEGRSVVIETLSRVVGVVHWEDYGQDSYAYLYERFLEVYDNSLRKRSGSYYTPAPAVDFMTRFVDDILVERLSRPLGFAASDVIVVDPAMGTGSFLAHVVERVARTVEREEGPGQVPPALRALASRLIGFEKQAAPYAVAELRLHSMLKNKYGAEVPSEEERFLADALDDPDLQELEFGRTYEAIARSRRGANRVKRRVPVMVVLGNPPYLERAKGLGSWIEARGADRLSRPNLDAFRSEGGGRLEYVLSNLYVYFWRWATWKVFDAHPASPAGVVAYITTSGFTMGPGFRGMREYLRRTADEGWIINLTPEGHQPPVLTRVFAENQQPLCISVFVRYGESDPTTPARIHYTSVIGTRDEKFEQLSQLELDSNAWVDCVADWQAPLIAVDRGTWPQHISLDDLMPWSAPGIKPNRTWVYAPSPEVLALRWRRITSAADDEKSELFKETPDSNLSRKKAPLFGQPPIPRAFRDESADSPSPVPVCFRSFDRQWVLPDSRLHHRPSPDLWAVRGDQQVFVVEQHAQPLTGGPGLTFSDLIPDMHCFMGHHGGRVRPLYRDRLGDEPNIMPGFLEYLAGHLGLRVTPEDLLAYVACIVSHSRYTASFRLDLARQPGIRVPFTKDQDLWRSAVQVGREVLWLHSFGERFVDLEAGRPHVRPRLPVNRRPKVVVPVPDNSHSMPRDITYDPDQESLSIGAGRILPVRAEVWAYEVSGMHVVKKWFSYRKANPAGRRGSPLDEINETTWKPGRTTELLELINVIGLCLDLEPRQADVLRDVLESDLVSTDELLGRGLLPVAAVYRRPAKVRAQETLWNDE